MQSWLRALLAFAVVSALAVLHFLVGRSDPLPTDAAGRDELRSYVAAHPLAGAAYRRLAESENGQRSTDATLRLYEIAARREPRDRASHVWLADHYALAGDTARALFHIDQLMRLQPRRAHHFFPSLGSLLVTPSSRAVLVAFLGAAKRPWRPRFLRWFSGQAGLAPMLDEVFEPLRKASVPLDDDERAYWIERLLREGRNDHAYFLWVDSLPDQRRAQIGNIYDGGFEFDSSDAGVFDWQIRDVAGAAVSRVADAGAVGRQALRVEFFDHRVPFEHVEQRLALPPGRYLLSGRVRSEDLRNERGLQWQLLCGKSVLVASEHFRGSFTWRDFLAEFEVPASPCAGQTLQLKLDARIRPEQMIGGRIWFDELRIRRLD